MELTQEQKQTVEQLAGLNYTVRQIALYLGIDPDTLQREFENLESPFRYHYDRGRLIARASVDMQALESAKGGNITAMQQYEKVRQGRHFENIRDQIIYGYS